TRLVDQFPGVRTTTPSDFHVVAEVGGSFPNPNTRNEVFIDDMEGVRDAVSLSMGPERWRWSSVPSRPGHVLMTSLQWQRNVAITWYSPPSFVKEHELKPTLSEAEGGNNSRQVLALSIPRRPQAIDASFHDLGVTDVDDTLWAGLTYPLDAAGLDLS